MGMMIKERFSKAKKAAIQTKEEFFGKRILPQLKDELRDIRMADKRAKRRGFNILSR